MSKMRVRVLKIGELQEFESGFRKKDLIGIIDGEYPEEFKFEFVKDKIALLDNIIPDTYVTIYYNLRSRKVVKEGKEPMYFLSLGAWKVEV